MDTPELRRSGAHSGFTMVGIVFMVTVAALVAGVLIDIVVVSLRSPSSSTTQLDPAETELEIARTVSKDVLPSFAATPRGTACGINQASLVTTEKSVATLKRADQAVVYSMGPDGLTRSTCATGATLAATTTVVSPDVTTFVATCRAPGACGTVHLEVDTAVKGSTTPHHFLLDVTRRQ